jgi:hypothetical protein
MAEGAFLVGLFLLAGCFAGPEQTARSCARDEDCEELCSRIGECLRAADAISIRARWTVGGLAPSPTAPGPCGSIDAFEVSLESSGERDLPVIYYPVPCDLGQVFYDIMPNRLERMRMSAVHADGSVLQVILLDIVETASDFQVDFNPQ